MKNAPPFNLKDGSESVVTKRDQPYKIAHARMDSPYKRERPHGSSNAHMLSRFLPSSRKESPPWVYGSSNHALLWIVEIMDKSPTAYH